MRVDDRQVPANLTVKAPCVSSVGQTERYLMSEIPTGLPGTLFLATRPGWRWHGEKAKFDPTLQASHLQQARARGVGLMVSLLETADPSYHADCAALGMAVRRHPIRNFTVPSQSEARFTVQAIIKMLRAGTNVAMHCMGGKGRSGTIAACVLVSLGFDAARAIDLVRQYRRDSIETPEQIAFIQAYARLNR